MTRSIFLAAMSTAAFLASSASADVDTSLTVDGGSSASINMRMEVSTFLGGTDDTDRPVAARAEGEHWTHAFSLSAHQALRSLPGLWLNGEK